MTNAPQIETTVVTPVQSVEIPHRIGHVTTSPGDQYLAAYSPEASAVSLLSGTGVRREIHLAKPTGSLCLSVDTTGNFLAFAYSEDDRLYVRRLDSDQEEIVQHSSELIDARFDGRGRLWTVRRGTERFVVELRAARNWEEIAYVEIGDAYFLEGGAELRPATSEDAMFVGVYSGQSEQENYICEVEHELVVARQVAAMDGEQFVFATPNSATVVALDHVECEIACFRHPFNASIARLTWPDYAEDRCEDERPGYYGCYIEQGCFLAGSSEGRLFLIEFEPFRVRREIHIAGHAPVPAAVKYPSLSDACGFVSDLVAFGCFGRYIAAFFAEDHRSPCPQLVIVRTCDFVG